jgi:site-specific recombinase XerD
LIERYLSHLQVLNYSPRTLATLSGFYNLFRRFLRETKTTHLHGITGSLLHDLQRWVYYQPTHRGTARSVSSQNQTMRAVKGLMRFGLQEGYLTHDPTQSLLYAREPDALPRHVLTQQEARKSSKRRM